VRGGGCFSTPRLERKGPGTCLEVGGKGAGATSKTAVVSDRAAITSQMSQKARVLPRLGPPFDTARCSDHLHSALAACLVADDYLFFESFGAPDETYDPYEGPVGSPRGPPGRPS
jgi:hypothetical protein